MRLLTRLLHHDSPWAREMLPSAHVPVLTAHLIGLFIWIFFSCTDGPRDLSEEDTWYAPFTTTVLHNSRRSLAWCMALLGAAGGWFESIHGPLATAIVFWYAAIAADFAVRVGRLREDAVGSSGGMYGLLFAQAGSLAVNWRDMNPGHVLVVIVALLACAGLLAVNDVLESNTAWEGHVAGALTGASVSLAVCERCLASRYCTWAITASAIGTLLTVAINGVFIITLPESHAYVALPLTCVCAWCFALDFLQVRWREWTSRCIEVGLLKERDKPLSPRRLRIEVPIQATILVRS